MAKLRTNVPPSRSIPNIRSTFSIRRERRANPKGLCIPPADIRSEPIITTKWVFDLKEEDTYWCTADIGWVTGHSYIVYGPLQNGATT